MSELGHSRRFRDGLGKASLPLNADMSASAHFVSDGPKPAASDGLDLWIGPETFGLHALLEFPQDLRPVVVLSRLV